VDGGELGIVGAEGRAALADGRLSAARFESHRKLEKEAAHAARKGDRFAQAAERRKWRAISASVSQHMQRKYGSDR